MLNKNKGLDQRVLNRLSLAVEKFYGSYWRLILRSFVGGLFYGLGATIGLAIVLVIIGYVLQILGVLPVVGEWFRNLNEFIRSVVPR